MKEHDFSLKEWLLICQRIEAACAQRFRALADLLGEDDQDVRHRMLLLADEEQAHLRMLERYADRTPWPLVMSLTEPLIAGILERQFPSLARRIGEQDADRRGAIQMAESVEAESAGFYGELAVRVEESAARRFFEDMAQRETRHHERLSREDEWAT
ncbi:MAG: hypothetical protein HY716_06050 [Planctomycetes bacterium]|nr:hypothetical protein [Planctomycetota bacterium]